MWLKDAPDGGLQVTSNGFRDDVDGEVSVHLARLTTPERVLEQRPGDSIVAFTADQARALGYTVVWDPTPTDDSHCVLSEPDWSDKVRRNKSRELAHLAAANFVVVGARLR
jgi:hypothetical protein